MIDDFNVAGSGSDRDPYMLMMRERRRPLKGGGSRTRKGRKPPDMLKGLFDKFAGGLARRLRAATKNYESSIVGLLAILEGIWGGEEVTPELIWVGILGIFMRDSWRSSQESGVRPEVVENVHPFEEEKKV
jgi:hypothetical protein